MFATLGAGSYFGEAALFFQQKRNATIRAGGFTEVLCLRKAELDTELRKHEFDLERMIQIFRELKASNEKRNAATKRNLAAVRDKRGRTKLSRIVCPDPLGAVRPPSRIAEVFNPEGLARGCWDTLSTAFVLYFAVAVPYRIAFVFGPHLDGVLHRMALDFCIDTFFAVDVYLRCREFPFIEAQAVVHDRHAIAARYRATWLWVDVASSVPLELPLLLALGGRDARVPLLWARLTHLGRLARLPSYLAGLNDYLHVAGVRISASVNMLVCAFLYYGLMNHWCGKHSILLREPASEKFSSLSGRSLSSRYGCVWFALHRYVERDVPETWAVVDGLAEFDAAAGEHDVCSATVGLATCYARSFYMVITTISTVGYGDIRPNTDLETLWQLVVVVSGACGFATLIGSFTAFLKTVDTSGSNAFKRRLQALSEYMRHRELPRALADAVLLHARHGWYRSHCLDESSVTADLPTPLRMEIAFAVHRLAIERMPLLSREPEMLQKRFALAFEAQFCAARSSVYAAGDIGWEIYFIIAGEVRVSLPSDLSVLDAAGRAKRRIEQRLNDRGSGSGDARPHRSADGHPTPAAPTAPPAAPRSPSLVTMRRCGEHFGQQCLRSLSGVREESADAVTHGELYYLTKERLDQTLWAYPFEKQRSFVDLLMHGRRARTIPSSPLLAHSLFLSLTASTPLCSRAETARPT